MCKNSYKRCCDDGYTMYCTCFKRYIDSDYGFRKHDGYKDCDYSSKKYGKEYDYELKGCYITSYDSDYDNKKYDGYKKDRCYYKRNNY